MPRRLFISYSHHDADLLGELRVHLRPLERAGVLEPWFDGFLIPGDDFDQEVRRALSASDFIGLLVTPRFLASDYCVEIELEDAIRRHDAGQARVVPIIAKPSQWQKPPLGKLLATPTDGKPVSQWRDPDEAWDNVARALEKAAAQPMSGRPADAMAATSQASLGSSVLNSFQPPPPASQRAMQTRLRAEPTDQDIDDYRLHAFELLFDRFTASVDALPSGLSGRVRRLDANRFTTIIYRGGKKVAGCTLFTGGSFFGGRGIAYSGSDSGETNSINEELAVEAADGQLGFKMVMGSAFRAARRTLLTPDEAAEYLWQSFTERLS